MQHLDHDMDDLFRKAANDYPLKANENKWDAVASQLNNKPVVQVDEKKTKGKRKKIILPALLLLFLLTGGFLLLTMNNKRTIPENKNLLINKPLDENPSSKEKINDPKNPIEFSKEKNSPFIVTSDKKIKSESSKKINQDIEQEEKSDLNIIAKKDDHNNERLHVLPDFSLRKELQRVYISQLTITNRTVPVINNSNIGFKNYIPQNRGIYWGFTAGPQLNEVKGQGMNRTGFDLGLLAGYRFNKRVSLETGLLFATKNYYSDGKYFDMKPDPSMPPNMILMSLKGNSKIVEIPVKVRYDFINNGMRNVFSSAGISSYLLTKENNNYHTMVNGNPQDMDKSYSDVTNYTAATFCLSAGYEHRILKRNKIRIEPYLQIPLKGIGVGKMPVTSTGLHLGITWERK